jgi:Trypsin-like peptidase domain
MSPDSIEPRITADVTDDPEKTLGQNEDLHTEQRTFPLRGPIGSSPAGLSNWGCFEGAVLAVSFPIPDSSNVLGSAVLVAPGVAIGSMHVFDHDRDLVMTGAVGAMCYGLDGDRADIWRIRHVVSAAHGQSDLALYCLERASSMPPDRTLTHVAISTRTPSIGERITVAGFRANDQSSLRANVIGMQLMVSAGRVTQTFPLQRDSSGMPYPCFEIDCETMGGMSGGPAFDEEGRLVGVLSRGLGGGPSWVSMLWPSLGWTVPRTWPAQLLASPATLLSMDSRLCAIDRPEALSHDQANQRLQYLPWT